MEDKEYVLDRFVNGRRMAEGAKVQARSLEQAIEKARALFPPRRGCPEDLTEQFAERIQE